VPEAIQSVSNPVCSYEAESESNGVQSMSFTPPASALEKPARDFEPNAEAGKLHLMSKTLLPQPSHECLEQAVDLAKGAGMFTAAAVGLATSGALGPVGAFIGAAVVLGATAANYINCETAAAEKSAPKPK
jgi:hypothetical protein